MKKISVSLCLLTATLFAIPATAQDGPPPPPPGPRNPPPPPMGPGGKWREEVLRRFDANHDGKLDEAERAAAREAWKKEHPEAAAHMEKRRQEMLQRFDRNGDGKLDAAERKTLQDAWQTFLKQQPVVSPAKPAPAG